MGSNPGSDRKSTTAPRALHSRLPTAPSVYNVKCREHISLLIILCIIVYVTNKAHPSLICNLLLLFVITLLQFWNRYIGYLCILRIELKILLYVFKSINNLAPSYLSDQLYPYNPTRNLRSGEQRLLSVPRSWLKHRRDRAFAVAGPRLWNSLPAYIRSAQSLTVFKSSLKTYFFSLAFNSLRVYGMNL